MRCGCASGISQGAAPAWWRQVVSAVKLALLHHTAGDEEAVEDELDALEAELEHLGLEAQRATAFDEHCRAWKLLAQAALEDGARRAHNWIKGPHPFKALGLIDYGVYGVAPLHLLSAMATKLRRVWVGSDPNGRCWTCGHCRQIAGSTAGRIRSRWRWPRLRSRASRRTARAGSTHVTWGTRANGGAV